MEKLDMDTTSLQTGISDLESHYQHQKASNNTGVDVGGNSSIQINRRPAEYQRVAKLNCSFCYDDVDAIEMLEITFCHHRCCFCCMSFYVEYRLASLDTVPKCPHDGCNSELTKGDCEKFLSSKLLEIFIKRLEEAKIPASQKIYCPYSNCSALMDLSVLDSCPQLHSSSSSSSHPSPTTPAAKCNKCHGLFCIECRVPWHKNMSCEEYISQLSDAEAELNLQPLENNERKKCPQCRSLIERSGGCDHMTCRCGFDFCYKCGNTWYKGNGKEPLCECKV